MQFRPCAFIPQFGSRLKRTGPLTAHRTVHGDRAHDRQPDRATHLWTTEPNEIMGCPSLSTFSSSLGRSRSESVAIAC